MVVYPGVSQDETAWSLKDNTGLNPTAQKIITDYIQRTKIKGPYLFPTCSQGGSRPVITPHYTSVTLCLAVRRACDRAKTPRWTPYQVRHLIATELIAAGKIQEAQYLLGHSSIRTTEQFYLDRRAKLDKAVDAVRWLSLGSE